MSTHNLDVTVVGWVGSDVRLFPARDGRQAYATFRLGSTRRYFDRGTGQWRDGRTEWFRVKSWRALAINAEVSLVKGDPVVAHGRLSTEEWTAGDGTPRSGLVLEATSIGHDLAFGTTRFRRTIAGAQRAAEGPVDVSGYEEAPPEEGDRWVPGDAVADPEQEAHVDEVDDDEHDEVDGLVGALRERERELVAR
ncbi:single-stranded DNA-binding protein [Cellulomonas sp. HZM]|uniref:single-stranded DNA-binding protein n=1 Tax=Cellulomonas sp. HZM TaxID=1454010 RepID=UPI000A9BC934|nr:single-stranded DNA-binding protein [Cellulomonas sp. HZM]